MFVFWIYRTRTIEELYKNYWFHFFSQIWTDRDCPSIFITHVHWVYTTDNYDLQIIVCNRGHCWLVTIIYISNLIMIYVSNCCSIHTLYITLLMHTWDCGFKPDVSEQTVSQENKVQSSIRLNINARTSLIHRQQHSCIKSRVCIKIRSDAKSKRLWRRPYCMLWGRCQPVFKSMSMSPGSNVNHIQCQKGDGKTHFIDYEL